jgi:hypothetical protein
MPPGSAATGVEFNNHPRADYREAQIAAVQRKRSVIGWHHIGHARHGAAVPPGHGLGHPDLGIAVLHNKRFVIARGR